MNTKTFTAALATAISVAITLSACGSSTGNASRSHSQTDTASTTNTVSTTTVPRPTAAIDQRVLVHGARLHVNCNGTGNTTVVLIAGFEDGGVNWNAVAPAVTASTRVCRYDRFGDGTSDAAQATQTFRTEATDLHTLLDGIHEPGPYVMVGHSFGGPEAVTYASMFPNDVRGVLLLDASPPAWNRTICSVADNGSEMAKSFTGACAQQAHPANNQEHLDGPRAFAELNAISSLGAVPMIVATAAHHDYSGLVSGEQSELDEVWNDGQAHWVSLSSSAQLVSVEKTSHHIELDRADVVIDKIHELLR